MHFLQLWKLLDLDLDLRSGRGHWCTYMVKVYPHTKLDGNQKNFLWTYGLTEGRTHVSSNLLGHRRGQQKRHSLPCVRTGSFTDAVFHLSLLQTIYKTMLWLWCHMLVSLESCRNNLDHNVAECCLITKTVSLPDSAVNWQQNHQQ